MVPIRIDSASTQSLYLDIHHVDFRAGDGPAHLVISAILGDGWYEGEVAVEIGNGFSLTFADQYLDEGRLARFFERVDRTELERAVIAAAGALVFSIGTVGSRRQVLAFRHDRRVLPLVQKIRRSRTSAAKRPATLKALRQAVNG